MEYSASFGPPRLFRLLAALFAFLVSLRKIGDFDYWTHLAFGRTYWRGGSGAITEPFVLSRLGQPLENAERLFQLLLYPLHLIGSDTAVCLACALAAALVFYLLAGCLPPGADAGTQAVAFVFLTVTAAVVQFRFLPRPETPAYLLLALCLIQARAWSQRPDRRRLLALAALFALWVLLHMTWTIGLLLVAGTILAEPRLDFWRDQWRTAAGRCFLVLCGTVVGWGLYRSIGFGLHVITHSGSGKLYGTITEMRPLWEFPQLLASYLAVALLAAVLAWGDRQGRPSRLLIWLLALALGLFVVRNVAIALLGMVPSALAGLGRTRMRPVRFTRPQIVCAMLLFSGLLATVTLRQADPPWGVGVRWEQFPRDAADFVKRRQLPGVVFNNWDCGGYLNWAWDGHPPTFLDGRLGDQALLAAHDAIVDGLAPDATVARLGIGTILLQPLYFNNARIVPELFWLAANPEWHLVRASDALVFVRGRVPPPLEPLPMAEAWRAVVRHLATLEPTEERDHLLYSRAVALYLGGQVLEARTALATARQKYPDYYQFYRHLFMID